MTPDAFRAALADLGLSQVGFARLLSELGHPGRHIDRSVRRWVVNGPPGEVVAIITLLRAPRSPLAAFRGPGVVG